MSEPSAGTRGREQLLDEVLFAYLREAEGGGTPDRREWLERYPELAAELTAFFADQARIDGMASPLRQVAVAGRPAARPAAGTEQDGEGASAMAAGGTFGDFRLVREVGRGGMGVVYEAEQVSLGRHVALKVLPGQGLLEAKHLLRFQREARAAARLHHTNIVPVFGVGEQDGRHYYVMQFIQGLGLEAVLTELRRLCQARPEEQPVADPKVSPVAAVALSLLTGEFHLGDPAGSGSPQPPPGTRALARHRRRPRPRRSTGRARPKAPRYREAVVPTGKAWRGWASRWPRRWPTPTARGSCTATSSRPTCCWTPGARSGSPTSGWPRRRTART
jgi:hypothetical protein